MIDERVHERNVDVGVVAAWMSAWLAGAVAGDDITAALNGVIAHRVQDEAGDQPFATAMISWRQRRTREVRLVLPVPGDVRGLPADNPAFTAAALSAGQALVGAGLGLVPTTAGSGQLIIWQAHQVGPAAPDPISVREAEHDLTAASRDTASALAAAQLGAPGAATPHRLQLARRAGDHVLLPPGHPAAAVALLTRALRLRAVLDIAVRDPEGGALDGTGMAARAAALRPLITAVRRARLAACNAWPEAEQVSR